MNFLRNTILSGFVFLFVAWCAQPRPDPKIELLTSGTNTSLRGLSVVNDHVVWVSGSNGMVGKSTNGGKNWRWITVKGFEKNDFRDIEAFDASTAIIMSVGEPGYILKTVDGGDSWRLVYQNKTPGIFMDAMEFWNEQSGIVLGDPIGGRFFVSRTFNGGNTWEDLPIDRRPLADSGEACFAASGTNLRALDLDEAVFVSGGKRSRMFTRNKPVDLPLLQGTESAGANSISVWDSRKRNGGKHLIVVGGDFTDKDKSDRNCFYSSDGGKTWNTPKNPPHGYRSCVEFLSRKDILTCGLSGVDYSADGGKNWTLVSKEGFHVCRIAKLGPAIFLAGSNGKIAKVTW